MKIGKQARHEAKQLFRSCHVGGLLDEPRVRQAVQQVITLRPRGYLAVLTHFRRLVKLALDRRSARIESTVSLPVESRASLQGNLSRLYGEGLAFSFVENPALIGGLRIQVGCDVYDGSVQGRLAALAESL